MDTGAANEPWWFHCSACGKCCNSAPEMSLPELLHHQHRFIGSLALRRIPRMRAGDRLGARGVRATEADRLAHAELADAVLHPVADGGYVLLATHAFSSDARDACPALGADMRCTIHDDRKPAACAVVPLDALVPDRLQHVVLAERSAEAAYLGADCLAGGAREASRPAPGGTRPHLLPVLRGSTVVDGDARDALARRRKDLAEEKARWGRAVFAMLSEELFASAEGLARVPVQGFLVMAIAPVLLVLASASAADRGRCLEYVDAQIALIDRQLGVPSPRDARGLAQLAAFARTHRALRAGLGRTTV
jgi:Fe-S-cluster containining protein